MLLNNLITWLFMHLFIILYNVSSKEMWPIHRNEFINCVNNKTLAIKCFSAADVRDHAVCISFSCF